MLTIIFLFLLIAFTIWWRQDDIRQARFPRIVKQFIRWWRDFVKRTWYYLKVRDGTLHTTYGKDHEWYRDMIHTVNPSEYVDFYL